MGEKRKKPINRISRKETKGPRVNSMTSLGGILGGGLTKGKKTCIKSTRKVFSSSLVHLLVEFARPFARPFARLALICSNFCCESYFLVWTLLSSEIAIRLYYILISVLTRTVCLYHVVCHAFPKTTKLTYFQH